jgi:antitoxin ParD1/3/4
MAYYANADQPPELGEMPTRNVVLTDYQAELVERLVSSGRYQNASEVLREGLRLVEDQEAEVKARIKALRDAARVGIVDIEVGRYRTFDSHAELNRHLTTLRDDVLSRKSVGESGE